MRRKVFDYSKFNEEIVVEDLGNHMFAINYMSIHGNPVREVVKDKDKRIREIQAERKKFRLVVDGKTVNPISSKF